MHFIFLPDQNRTSTCCYIIQCSNFFDSPLLLSSKFDEELKNNFEGEQFLPLSNRSRKIVCCCRQKTVNKNKVEKS